MSEDPLGFAAGDANLSRYVGNETTSFVDPAGKAKKSQFRVDLHDHGNPHIQLGDLRWDARDLHPIKHKGICPPELTTKQLEELRQSGIWDKILKDLPENNLREAIRDRLGHEVAEEMIKRGANKIEKSAAKEIAKEWLRRTPLVLLIVGLSARDAMADYQSRGAPFAVCNQLFPADLIEDVASRAGNIYDKWLQEQREGIRDKKFRRWGVELPEVR